MTKDNFDGDAQAQSAKRAKTKKAPKKKLALFAKLDDLTDSFRNPKRFVTLRLAIAILISSFVGWCLIEIPSNPEFLTREFNTIMLNWMIITLLFLILFFICQQKKFAFVIHFAFCTLAGIAQQYVTMFRGGPIVPADFFALGTAADVAGGYDYTPTPEMIQTVIIMIVAIILVKYLVPNRKFSKKLFLCNIIGLILTLIPSYVILFKNDIDTTFNITYSSWKATESFQELGYPLSFAIRLQDLFPSAPWWYEREDTEALLASYANEEESISGNRPTIVCIMNETFADYSLYPGIEDYSKLLTNYYQLQSEAAVSGMIYTSALGGGTCNTEFEVLTGSSYGNVGPGVYPFTIYNFTETASIARQLKELGYTCTGMHPAKSSNWRRSQVYDNLGFDSFLGIDDWDDPEYLRDKPSDMACYEKVLEVLDSTDDPQYIFNVTYQNHSGYETGLIPEDKQVTVNQSILDENTTMQLNEYASCIKQSDEALLWLVNELEKRDKDIILIFFGDHQAWFSNLIYKASYNVADVNDNGLSGVQERFCTPYFIWSNYELPNTIDDQNTTYSSAAFLNTYALKLAGLPTSNYERFLMNMTSTIPTMNMNGYMAHDETWQFYNNDLEEYAAENDLRWWFSCAQYYNLFEPNKGSILTDEQINAVLNSKEN